MRYARRKRAKASDAPVGPVHLSVGGGEGTHATRLRRAASKRLVVEEPSSSSDEEEEDSNAEYDGAEEEIEEEEEVEEAPLIREQPPINPLNRPLFEWTLPEVWEHRQVSPYIRSTGRVPDERFKNTLQFNVYHQLMVVKKTKFAAQKQVDVQYLQENSHLYPGSL